MSAEQTAVSREDQLVGALCHASVLLPIIGMVVPLAVWLSQRERSPLLRAQGLQALVFQLLELVLYGVGLVCWSFSFLSIPLGAILAPGTGSAAGARGDMPAAAGLIALLFGLGFLGMIGSQCIGGPILALFGLRAAWQVGHGHAYQYPLLGRWLSRHTVDPPAPRADIAQVGGPAR